MSYIDAILSVWDSNRERTLDTLDSMARLPHPGDALAFRPGPGRAHIAWQLMHIAVTEELFATARFLETTPAFPDLCDRFQRGSSASDEDIPGLETIRSTLAQSREHLRATVTSFSDTDLESMPGTLSDRGWTLRKALQIITWHEGHHQGQAHITLNIFNAAASE